MSALSTTKFIWILMALTTLTRLQTFWTPIINHDEAEYAVLAQMWVQGAQPYRDFLTNKPLGLFAFFYLIFSLTGSAQLLVIHALGALTVLITSIGIWKLLASTGKESEGRWASIFYVLMTTTYIPKFTATSIEIFMNPFVVAALWLCILSCQRNAPGSNRSYWTALGSGVCVSLACLMKYQNLPMIGLITLVFLWEWRKGIRPLVKRWMVFGVGVIAPLASHQLWIWQSGLWDHFIFWSFKGAAYHFLVDEKGGFELTRVLIRLGSYLLFHAPLIPLIWLAIRHGIRRDPEAESSIRNPVFVGLCWFLFSVPGVVAGWRLYDHYFLQWVPSLAALAALGLSHVQTFQTKKWILGSFAVIAFICWIPRWNLTWINHLTGEDNPEDYRPIALRVKELTQASDRIFVWGMGPHIYYWSDRLPSTRLAPWVHYLAREPVSSKSQELAQEVYQRSWLAFIEDFEKHPPQIIVDLSTTTLHDFDRYPMKLNGFMNNLLMNHYELIGAVEGANLYQYLNRELSRVDSLNVELPP